MTKILETLGTIFGVGGALLVALKLAAFGYPLFLLSSGFLTWTAWSYQQRNLLVLQGVFFIINVVGLVNYI